jgi:hypothetical protein
VLDLDERGGVELSELGAASFEEGRGVEALDLVVELERKP